MYYAESNRLEPVDVDAPQKYLKYKTTHVTDIREVENGDNIVIVPEAATAWISGIKNCKKALWWMSVDNYIHNTKEKDLPQIREYVDIHLVQSKYAYEYVENAVGVSEEKIMYVSDYIGEKYLLDIPEVQRMDIALYNPKKGLEKIKPVIENTSDFLKWIPLINLSEEDMIAYMHISKINLGSQYKINLYTHNATPELEKINNIGAIDYYDTMPYIFRNSRINLNITMRSIKSGIPLRGMDICAAGGFLLSNYQEDMYDIFVPGEDVVLYESQEDLLAKCRYYLTHEVERQQIAANGYGKVVEKCSYDVRLEEMFAGVFGATENKSKNI